MYRDRNSTLGQLLFDVKNDTFNDGIEIIQVSIFFISFFLIALIICAYIWY